MNNQFDYVNQFDSNSQAQPQYVTYIPYGFTPETYEERKNVKKIANIIGGALLILSVAADIIVIGLRFLLRFLGIWGIKSQQILSSPAFLQFLQAMLSITLFTLPFIFLYKTCGYRISSLVKFKKPKKEDFLPYFLLGVGVCYFANFVVSFVTQFFANFGIEYEVTHTERPEGFFGFMLTFIAVAVVPPLTEEFACRGLMLGSLRKFGDGFAIVCSAIVFGIMHGNFQQIPFAFLVGMVLGFITVKTNTIWVAVAVHAFNNATSVIIDYAGNYFDQSVVNIFSIIILTSMMLCILVSIWLFKGNDKVYKLKKSKAKSDIKQLFKWFFTAPTIIIFIVISIIDSLQYFK